MKLKVTGYKKIKITGKGLPKAQDAKIVGNDANSILFPWNISQFTTYKDGIITNPFRDATMGDKSVVTKDDTQAVRFNDEGEYQLKPVTQDFRFGMNLDPSKQPSVQPAGPKTKRKSYREPNIVLPSLINMGLSGLAGYMKDVRQDTEDVNYARKLGRTDANEPVDYNVTRRGRWVLNSPAGADFAPDLMTPVQFRGTPVTEYTGFPGYGQNIAYSKYGGLYKAAEGVTTESLGLPTLVENPEDYKGTPNIDLAGPQFIPTASQVRSASPEITSEDAAASTNLALPLKNWKITSGFGKRTAPVKGASSDHNGVDLAVPLNSDVFAPFDGVVEKVYYNDQGGKQLIVRGDNGMTFGFAHLNDYSVGIGDRVGKGQKIALSGNTGKSSGPHLHFTLKDVNGQFVDPNDFFQMKSRNKASNYYKGLSNLDHNNPGNIHIGKFAEQYGATKGRQDSGGNIAIFPDMQTGLQAMDDLLTGPEYNNLTVADARKKYVNGTVSRDTHSADYIVKAMGGNYRLNQLNPQQRRKLISEFIKWEDRDVYNKLVKDGYLFNGGGNTTFKQGGEYLLDEDQINKILEEGGEIEYL